MSLYHAPREFDRWDVDPIHEDHPNTNIVLNASFVHEIGQDRATKMVAVINDVGDRFSHHAPPEIAHELRHRLGEIGIRPPDPELRRMADEIARFDHTRAQLGPEGEY